MFSVLVSGQISDQKLKVIDSLFIEWNRPNHPGGTVGIAVKGKPVFSGAYGLASMESPSDISFTIQAAYVVFIHCFHLQDGERTT